MAGFSGALFAWNGYACGVSLFGFTVSLPHEPVDSRPALQAMAEAIRTNQLQTPVIEPERAGFALARLSDARAPRRGRPAGDPRWQVWIDGDVYEASGPCEPFTRERVDAQEPDRGASLLLSLCQADASLRGLRAINGEFRAVIWDRERQRLHLVTDRTGLRSFYYSRVGAELHFAPCARALALNLGSRVRLDLNAVQHLLERGHLQGTESLFDGVRLLPEGALLTWDVRSAELRVEQHWEYAELEGREPPGSRAAALGSAVELLRAAVRRQVSVCERVGVSLSGGLDSRALLAAAKPLHPRLGAATAYRAGTADGVIARELARRMNVPHFTVELTESSWFDGRLAAIWWTDGHLNPLHMLGLSSGIVGCQHFDVNLDGFLGDAILGGDYLAAKGPVLARLADRGRRFINEGRRLTEVAYGRSRVPFADPEFLEFAMSLPAAWRRDRHFYGQAMRRAHPELFGPLSHNGRPVPGAPWPVRGFEWLRDWFTGRGVTLQRRSGDYERWLRAAPLQTLLRETLHDEGLVEWLPSSLLSAGQRELEEHRRGAQGRVERLGRYLALGVYLRQLRESSYRPQPLSCPVISPQSNG